jgi:hypothetical protein
VWCFVEAQRSVLNMGEQGTLFELPERHDPGTVGLQEILDNFELVGASGAGEDPWIIVAEREPVNVDTTRLSEELVRGPELGSSSPSPWTAWTREEWNPKLRDKNGINEYYKMKRLDGMIRGMMRQWKTPVLSAHWFVEPGGDSARDLNAAEFVHDNFFSGQHLNMSWLRLLEEILLMGDYGHSVFETVYKLDSDRKVRLRKLAPRHPADIRQWLWDGHGGPDGVEMEPIELGGDGQGIVIPISKLVIFSHEAEGGDLRGTSVLRSAYKHYVYKDTLYKIDAIQKERHGIGVPVIKLPAGYNDNDKRVAENLGRNLRTNERAHVVLPPMWELLFAKLEGNPVDCLASIKHHNEMIMANVLANFMTDPKTKKENLESFYKSTRYVAECITDTLNMHCIPELVDLNWSRVKYPMLRARRIGEWEDQRTQSFTLRNFVGAGLLTPDEPLEEFLRRENDLPPPDLATRRVPVTPQAPGQPGGEPNAPEPPKPARTGPPRQADANAGTPQRNAGRDRSGG